MAHDRRRGAPRPDRAASRGGGRIAPGTRSRGLVLALASAALAACTQTGDFGRPKPNPLLDAVLETTASVNAPFLRDEPYSHFRFTDDERELRDRAYRFLSPAIDTSLTRSVFDQFVVTLGRSIAILRDEDVPPLFDATLIDLSRRRVLPPHLSLAHPHAYLSDLDRDLARSPLSRYRRLSEDAEADRLLAAAFVATATRVARDDAFRLDAARKAAALTEREAENVVMRTHENVGLVCWVRHALAKRAAAYRYALERLVIETPSLAAREPAAALLGLDGALAGFDARLLCDGRPRWREADVAVLGPRAVVSK